MSEITPPGSGIAAVENLPGAVVVRAGVAQLVSKPDLDALCAAVDAAQARSPKLPFILDLANVSFMGSLAMGTLVGLYKEFRTRGQRLVMVGLQPNVLQSLSFSHLDRVLEIESDVSSAMKRLDTDAASKPT